ncbi:MAG: hypothetical protein ACM3SR_08140 [Ignavibacteriales bacterium]
MSLEHMLKQYWQKKVKYSKILSVSDDKRKLMLYLYTATSSHKKGYSHIEPHENQNEEIGDNIYGMV